MNLNEESKIKVAFIIDNFPEVFQIDPFTNRSFINKIKYALYANGFYKKQSTTTWCDQAFINLTLMAQGKKRISKKDRGHGKRWKL